MKKKSRPAAPSLPAGAVLRLGTQRVRRLAKDLKALAFSPDGRQVAGGGYGNEVVVWDARTGRELRRIGGLGDGIHAIAFAPDGDLLAILVGLKEVRFATLSRGLLDRRIGDPPRDAHAMAFSPDGTTLAIAGWYGPTRVFGAAKGERRREFQGGAQCLAFTPDGSIARGTYGSILIVDPKHPTPPRLEIKSAGDVTGLAVSGDGKVVAASAMNGGLRFYSAASGALLREDRRLVGRPIHTTDIAFSPDLSLLAYGNHEWLEVVDLASGEPVPALDRRIGPGASLAFTPDGTALAISGQSLRLCEPKTGREILAIDDARGSAPVAFSPDGRLLAHGADGVRLFDARTGGELGRLGTAGGGTLTFSQDGSVLAVVCGRLRLYRVADRTPIKEWTPYGTEEVTIQLQFSDNDYTETREIPSTGSPSRREGGWRRSAVGRSSCGMRPGRSRSR